MTRSFFIIGLAACILNSSNSVAPAASPVTIVDDTGTHLTLQQTPRRIISLTPGATEMLFAVGAGPRMVGDTTACDYPPAALKIAKIGGWQVDYERVVALRPDLVVVDSVAETAAANRLRALGVPVLVIRPVDLGSIERDLTLVGKAVGDNAAAKAVVRSMQAKAIEASKIGQGLVVHPKVLAVVGCNPLWVAGEGTFIDDLLRRAGAINTAAGVRGYAQYSPEQLIAQAPDAIVTDTSDAALLSVQGAFRNVTAIQNHRVIMIDPNLLQRPGPRLADGLLAVAQSLQTVMGHR